MIAAALYMLKDYRTKSGLDIALNLGVIAATWLLLLFSRLPSPVIVLMWLGLGWAYMALQ